MGTSGRLAHRRQALVPCRAAERFSVSTTTARRWADRYRQSGKAGMSDRSSARTTARTGCPRHRTADPEPTDGTPLGTARIAPIAYHLGLNPSTAHASSAATGAAVEVDRPGDRHPDQGLLTRQEPLRAPRSRRAGPRRHREARLHLRGRRTATNPAWLHPDDPHRATSASRAGHPSTACPTCPVRLVAATGRRGWSAWLSTSRATLGQFA
ncbi:hypothetical protein IMY96_04610 [Pimelobacter simplex]|nr:hypothetical protein [Pimelobacter simplex]